jgi:hypothetical protein
VLLGSTSIGDEVAAYNIINIIITVYLKMASTEDSQIIKDLASAEENIPTSREATTLSLQTSKVLCVFKSCSTHFIVERFSRS